MFEAGFSWYTRMIDSLWIFYMKCVRFDYINYRISSKIGTQKNYKEVLNNKTMGVPIGPQIKKIHFMKTG